MVILKVFIGTLCFIVGCLDIWMAFTTPASGPFVDFISFMIGALCIFMPSFFFMDYYLNGGAEKHE